MKIAVYGLTDKRPVVYTILKLCQKLGDTLLITSNNHYLRLLPDRESPGHYMNVYIDVTTKGLDDIFEEIGYTPSDFEYVIYDNVIPIDADLVLYVKGYNTSIEEQDTLGCIPEYVTLNLGFGKDAVPLTGEMFKKVEMSEASQYLLEIDKRLTKVLASKVASYFNLTPIKFRKVVARK